MHQFIAMLVVVSASVLAAFIAYREYKLGRFGFLLLVAIAELMVLAWHVGNWTSILWGPQWALFYISCCALFASGVFFLAASRFPQSFADLRRPAVSVLIFALIVATDPLFEADLIVLGWLAGTLVYLIVPVVSWVSGKVVGITFLQTLTAASLVAGIFLGVESELGGLLYFLNGLIVPSIALLFASHALRISREDVSRREQRYQHFFESVQELFLRMNDRGEVLAASPSVAHFGITETDLIGSRFDDYLDRPMNLVPASSEPVMIEARLRVHGRDPAAVEIRIAADPFEEGVLLATVRDVEERQQLAHNFYEAQRREGLGLLAGGIAHDFNNLLQGILGSAQMLQLELKRGESDVEKWIKPITTSVHRAGELCSQLLNYAGKGAILKSPERVEDAVHEVVGMIESSISADIEISVDGCRGHTIVHADPTQLRQVIMNLVRNACDAITDAGRVTISVENAIRGYCRIEVIDNGCGIDAADIGRVFEPFFSSKGAGHGLGLSAVQGIVDGSGGSISIESEPGAGTTVSVLWPLSDEQPADVPEPAIEPGVGAGRQVLYVDDNTAVLRMAKGTLESFGFEVHLAESGPEALSLLDGELQPDIIVTDMRMPGMDGIELLHTVRSREPAMPFVIASGFGNLSDDSIPRHLTCWLSKPYRAEALIEAINSVAESGTVRSAQG